ncbi:MAG: hypothetical protein MAG453_01735 [Calditrichaeota bacterium]|nr:hypothetical protein [Calditrichota bacterium]
MSVRRCVLTLALLLPGLLFAQEIEEVGNEPTPGGSAGIERHGKHVFIAEMDMGLRIVDITDKENPETVSTLALGGLCNDVTVDLGEEVAYVAAGYDGIWVVDISDYANPFVITNYDTDGHSDGLAIDLEMNLLFNCDRESSFDIIDVTVPAEPVEYFTYELLWGRCRDVRLREGRAYVVWDFAGLQIWDYESEVEPVELAFLDLPDITYDLDLDEQYAYIAGWYEGMHIVDVSQPSEPVLVSSTDVPGNVRGIIRHAEDSKVVLVSETAGLHVFDISTPTSPVLAGSHDTPGSAKSLACGLVYAYVVDGSHFRIYDLGATIEDPDAGFVFGHVYDAVTAEGIPGARVYLTHVERFTDGEGYYEIEGMMPGTYWVHVSAEGYLPHAQGGIEIVEGNNEIDFQLVPIDGGEDGMYLDLEPWAEPVVVPPGGGSIQFTITLETEDIEPGVYDGWSYVIAPGGTLVPQVLVSRQLEPFATYTWTVQLYVPAWAPAGNYIYVAKIGSFPEDVLAIDTFEFTKLEQAVATGREENWSERGWEDWAESAGAVLGTYAGPRKLAISVTPNPFNALALVRLDLPEPGALRVVVYDVSGRTVAVLADGAPAGNRARFVFDGNGLASGIYFVHATTADGTSRAKKLLLLR